MRTKVTLILILLNVALFFFIFKFERAWRTEDALREARRRVLGSETADIRSLSIASSVAGGPNYTLVRSRDVWTLTQPLDWPANQHAVQPILQSLQFLENETSFNVADLGRNGQSLADYGLEKPRLTVSFTSGEGAANGAATPAAATTVLRIGDSTNVGNRLYVLSPDGTRIHVVNRSLLDAVSVPLDQLRADTVFSIRVFEARALSVQSSGARVRIRRDGTKWVFDTIVSARASKTQLDLTVNLLDSLHATSFPASPPATLPSAAPSLRVTLDGNNRSETLLLGEPVKASAASGDTTNKTDTEYFAQLMNGNTLRAPVFTVGVPNELLSRLRNAQTDLRERRVLEFDPAAVTSVTLAAPNRQPVTLQRLDANNRESPWQLVRGTASTDGAQTMPADAESVQRLLERLSLLSANAFASDAPSSAQLEAWGFNRPEREITLALATTPGISGRTVRLQLGTDSAGAVFARTGGADLNLSVYGVTADLAQDYPIDLLQWRDRTIHELPTAARITAVKIIDLNTQKVVYEAVVDAEGKPANPRDPAAAQQLLAALRTMRARRFVADHFTDRVLLGGDERAWRYQVDASVALPGAAADQTSVLTLLFTERFGGSNELAATKQYDLIFEPEQATVDAMWSLTYGDRDPGPPVEKK